MDTAKRLERPLPHYWKGVNSTQMLIKFTNNTLALLLHHFLSLSYLLSLVHVALQNKNRTTTVLKKVYIFMGDRQKNYGCLPWERWSLSLYRLHIIGQGMRKSIPVTNLLMRISPRVMPHSHCPCIRARQEHLSS